MKRRVNNAIRDAFADIFHGRETESTKIIEETGTKVIAKKLGPYSAEAKVYLLGDDRNNRQGEI